MKVLSNLMGNDTKISANCIAIKDKNNNAYSMDNYIKIKKLWENPNPTNTFSSQTIQLASSDYDYLIFIFKHARSVNRQKSVMCLKGSGANFDLAWDYGVSGNYYLSEHYRAASYVNDTSYSIGDCAVRYNSWTNSTIDNNYLIPIAVYGGKF